MTLSVASSLEDLRRVTRRWRHAGERIGFVPTMGNLHAGHLALIERARQSSARVVASIFVNPTQFGPDEDFAAYPRTREQDLDALAGAGCDLVWMPEVETMYPLEHPFMVTVPENLAGRLCGRFRQRHFDGVASVVLRLFLQVGPDLAVFGEKDYQQLLIIRQLVRDYALPIEIEALETVRETDGLAMSSRNRYLSEAQRETAPTLHGKLTRLAESIGEGADFESLKPAAWRDLEDAGLEPQYLEYLDQETLEAPIADRPARLFAAAFLGRTRLIDNVAV